MVNIHELLQNTSRTFALAIPLLPEPDRTDVSLAYLIFRIADTLEDSEQLTASDRIEALKDYRHLLENPEQIRISAFTAKWKSKSPAADEDHRKLFENTPQVFAQLSDREPWVERYIREHAQQTCDGMIEMIPQVARGLRSEPQLHRYCYYVAGVVGEMLTKLFAARIDDFEADEVSLAESRAFGEGLQLVNILKDAEQDGQAGRRFLPMESDKSELFQLARKNLSVAARYVGRLVRAQAAPGYLEFCQLPLLLGTATLDKVEQLGPGAKVSREQVSELLARVR
ncbi:MAG: squalene/phytoene synthase family protein [Pseudomonadota bacterium]